MYYVAIVQNDETQALYRYNTYEEALAAYHTELAYRAEGRTSTRCVIFDSELRTMRAEVYTAPVPEPNAEPNEG